MVITGAQKIEIEGNALVFTFAPAQKTLRSQLEGKRSWIEQLAQAAAGRRLTVVVREGEAAPVAAWTTPDAEAARRAALKARAQAEPAVQSVLDVFGGEVDDVEEIK